MEQEAASPRRTTDYKGNFPLGSSETLQGNLTSYSKAANSGLTTDRPVPKTLQGAPQPPPPRPKIPSRSPGSSSRRNMQTRTNPVYLGWWPKSMDQHKKQLIPSEWEGQCYWSSSRAGLCVRELAGKCSRAEETVMPRVGDILLGGCKLSYVIARGQGQGQYHKPPLTPSAAISQALTTGQVWDRLSTESFESSHL